MFLISNNWNTFKVPKGKQDPGLLSPFISQGYITKEEKKTQHNWYLVRI